MTWRRVDPPRRVEGRRVGGSTLPDPRDPLRAAQPRDAKVSNMKTLALVFVFLVLAAVHSGRLQ